MKLDLATIKKYKSTAITIVAIVAIVWLFLLILS